MPDRIVTNADIAKAVNTNDAWMVARTGIRERRIACQDEFTSDLGPRQLNGSCRMAWSFHWTHRGLMSHPSLKAMAFCFGNQSNTNSTLLALSFTASLALKVFRSAWT